MTVKCEVDGEKREYNEKEKVWQPEKKIAVPKEPAKEVIKEEEVTIKPKKDWVLNTGSEVINIKEGESVSIPKKFESSLKTEGVI